MLKKSFYLRLPVELRQQIRLRKRFARVERTLRSRDCSTLTMEQQNARSLMLDNLRAYARRGRFPRNFHFPNKHQPVFIDEGGHTCAVAQLMIDAGASASAKMIAEQMNFARVPAMDSSPLKNWATQKGVTIDELAYIQPTYEFMCNQRVLETLAADPTFRGLTLLLIGLLVVPTATQFVSGILKGQLWFKSTITTFALTSLRIVAPIAKLRSEYFEQTRKVVFDADSWCQIKPRAIIPPNYLTPTPSE
jgi:hypothetical protein